MSTGEGIAQDIRDMGYVTCNPIDIKPSYYKLNDGTGTIIRALITVECLIPDPSSFNGFKISTSARTTAFVPKENREPQNYKPFRPNELQSGVIDDDVGCDTLSEDFSVYELSDGSIMSVRTVVGQIKKTKFFTSEGEPLYMVDMNPIIKINRPKNDR